MRKTIISMFKKKKPVEEMIEIIGFCERTISDYKRGDMAALKPKTRGMKAGEKRMLAADQEKELIGLSPIRILIS